MGPVFKNVYRELVFAQPTFLEEEERPLNKTCKYPHRTSLSAFHLPFYLAGFAARRFCPICHGLPSLTIRREKSRGVGLIATKLRSFP